jgi:hypothetical protein
MPARKEPTDWAGIALCLFFASSLLGFMALEDRENQRDHEARMQGCAVTQEAPDAR